MPQFIVIALAGAGLYAGYRWLSREMQRGAAEAMRAHEEIARRAADATGRPRDLGTLEWDEAAGVYRPRPATD